MLVIKRTEGESVVLQASGAHPVVVTVVRNKRGSLCLGIEAPEEVKISRRDGPVSYPDYCACQPPLVSGGV